MSRRAEKKIGFRSCKPAMQDAAGRASSRWMLDELCQDYEYERQSMRSNCWAAILPAPSGQTHVGREPQYGLIEPVVAAIWLAA